VPRRRVGGPDTRLRSLTTVTTSRVQLTYKTSDDTYQIDALILVEVSPSPGQFVCVCVWDKIARVCELLCACSADARSTHASHSCTDTWCTYSCVW
jgi:hypothetical protein